MHISNFARHLENKTLTTTSDLQHRHGHILRSPKGMHSLFLISPQPLAQSDSFRYSALVRAAALLVIGDRGFGPGSGRSAQLTDLVRAEGSAGDRISSETGIYLRLNRQMITCQEKRYFKKRFIMFAYATVSGGAIGNSINTPGMLQNSGTL